MDRPEKASAILLVDDEEIFRERLAAAFARRGFTVYQAGDYDAAVALLREVAADMALVDLRLPDKSGLALVAAAKQLRPAIRIVVLTGYGSIATASEAISLGALYYLPKPADVDEILNAFARDKTLGITVDPEELTPPSLARVEWEHIQRVLADCDGNISVAARKLNIHRRTLQRKLFKFAPP